MIPAKHDITIRKGDTFLLFFKVREPNGGAYIDLTGWSGRAQVRSVKAAPTAEVSFAVTIPDQTVSRGGVLVKLTPAQTQALTITAGVYDVELTNTATPADVETYLEGDVVVELDVTR